MSTPQEGTESRDDQGVIHDIRPHYRTGSANLGDDFFAPCLRLCSRYSRAAGFFSSTALVSWSSVLPTLARKDDVRILLLTSPNLSDEDRAVLQRASDPGERLRLQQELADRIVLDALDFARAPTDANLRLQLLAWLIISGRLEIRFAFAKHLDGPGFYHEKIGLFEFPWGDVVAFTGSANETFSGHVGNYESIDVFRGWLAEDRERVMTKQHQFEEAWNGLSAGLQVLPLSPETLAQVKARAPEDSPLAVTFKKPQPSPAQASKWRHQDEAIATFLSRERGILEMATGTGKTRTALRITEHLIREGKVSSVIVSADGTDLLNQWYRELVRLTRELPHRFVVYREYENHHERERFAVNPSKAILLASRANLVLALKKLQSGSLGQTTLLIHDEVHRLGSPGNQQSLQGLSDKIRFRLGLSATPEREYDDAGTAFITEHIGPVIFRFSLEDAIRRSVLCPFDYFPMAYQLTNEDRERLRAVHKKKAARAAAGQPMSQEDVWIELAKVYKTSPAKLPLFRKFIAERPELLERCIIFVEDSQYGQEVLDIVHRHRPDFHTYFAGEESGVLQRFADGEIECLLTCHRLSEGIDIRNIRTVILFSAARARLETIQRIGRCLRIDPSDPSKSSNVVDFVRAPDPDSTDANADDERQAWLSHLSSIHPQEEHS